MTFSLPKYAACKKIFHDFILVKFIRDVSKNIMLHKS